MLTSSGVKDYEKNYVVEHVMKRDDMFYYVRHIPIDFSEHYRLKRLCFSLKTKALASATRIANSVSQRLEDFWFDIRFKRMDTNRNMTGIWLGVSNNDIE